MEAHITPGASATAGLPLTRLDRVLRVAIVASGVACLLMLAWVHLGLSALIVPPATVAPRQVASAGPYRVQLTLDSQRLTARGPNAIALDLRDANGRPVEQARVRIQSGMTSMVMQGPTSYASAQGAGHYTAHPVFGMAGSWQLGVTVSAPGQPDRYVAFDVGVRWS